jgi:hypothetical protein
MECVLKWLARFQKVCILFRYELKTPGINQFETGYHL